MNNHPDYNPYDPEQRPDPVTRDERLSSLDTLIVVFGTSLILAGAILYIVFTS